MSQEIDKADRARVIEIYGNKCLGCGDDKKKLTIHHIVFKCDKKNGLVEPEFQIEKMANYYPLCQDCQDKLHAKVTEMEKHTKVLYEAPRKKCKHRRKRH